MVIRRSRSTHVTGRVAIHDGAIAISSKTTGIDGMVTNGYVDLKIGHAEIFNGSAINMSEKTEI